MIMFEALPPREFWIYIKKEDFELSQLASFWNDLYLRQTKIFSDGSNRSTITAFNLSLWEKPFVERNFTKLRRICQLLKTN